MPDFYFLSPHDTVMGYSIRYDTGIIISQTNSSVNEKNVNWREGCQ